MPTIRKTLLILAALTLTAASVSAKSPKRGVAENQFSIAGQMRPLVPGVSWYYNWANTAGKGYQNEVIDFPDMEFVSMAWNGIVADNLRAYCAEHPSTKYLLGFNEPNFVAQANLTPQQAAEKWPELQALAKELGLKLVAPALNYSPDAPYQQPSKWMDEFVALVGLDAFDYTAIHCYGGAGLIKTLATEFHDKYGKPVWLTEFCYWPGGSGSVYVSPETQLASMIESVEWLETTDWIYRYAWFKSVGNHNSTNSPNYGLLINASGYSERELSPQGWVYVYMSDFDRTRWNPTSTPVAASDYVRSSSISLARTADASCPKPIELSQFCYGAEADYQFDIPAAGQYNLTLSVSGQGEPVRFDPSLAVYRVNDDGTRGDCLAQPTMLTLSGDDATYTTATLPLTLPAGHVVLRLADGRPTLPSGIHISTLRIDDAASAPVITADEAATVDVYDLQGRCLRRSVAPSTATRGLPAGIYLAGSRKLIVR